MSKSYSGSNLDGLDSLSLGTLSLRQDILTEILRIWKWSSDSEKKWLLCRKLRLDHCFPWWTKISCKELGDGNNQETQTIVKLQSSNQSEFMKPVSEFDYDPTSSLACIGWNAPRTLPFSGLGMTSGVQGWIRKGYFNQNFGPLVRYCSATNFSCTRTRIRTLLGAPRLNFCPTNPWKVDF